MALSRGFYGAAYRAKQKSLQRTVVLKVVPIAIYRFFNKDWATECAEHAAIADGTPFVAAINDRFDVDVEFAGSVIPCHVAVLANIQGPTLQQLLDVPDTHSLTPRMAAQIASDLLEIMHLFTQGERFHNDLHAGNVIVQSLTPHMVRSGVFDPRIRVVAIDLGSIKDASLSGGGRLGDHTHIARHIAALAAAVRRKGAASTDIDYRIAGALRGLAEHVAPVGGAQRIMTIDDAQRTIRVALAAADEPWRQPLSLARFGDAYNAQALESWHVPELWFDPEDKWLAKTTVRGPQVITGMRGCGKTMLLRALHFHARAARQVAGGSARLGTGALEEDDFLGIYTSCQKLLNPQDQGAIGESVVAHPFERLFVAYLRDSVQVLRHLRSLDSMSLTGEIDALLSDALRLLELPNELPVGEQAFERFLTDLQFVLADNASAIRLKVSPADAFGQLATLIRAASPILANKCVLFLLDDVSTRYLPSEKVREVISQLLFQHPHCAFRITTEAQALQRFLLSPGGSAPADPNRDYEGFDLGNEVYRLLQESSTTDRVQFVSEILRRRGRQFSDQLYRREPADVLGDVSLEEIAKEIATSSTSSPDRKRVYRGIRAVQAVCVGDLGEVVKLYEKILQRADAAQLPVSAEKQTECFLEHSADLMHSLNRRDQQKKSIALAFAQASGELLQRSGKSVPSKGRQRLRQYTKLYVRVDAGPDFETVAASLLDLLDAGVFVYDGGVPRTKTRDSDPVLQFKLSFRKMLGLASFIGLSDRDRFELSGTALRTWLEVPEQAKRVLLDSEARSSDGAEGVWDDTPSLVSAAPSAASGADGSPGAKTRKRRSPVSGGQLELLLPPTSQSARERSCAPSLGAEVVHGTLEGWVGREFDVAVLACGFEERALASAKRLLTCTRPRRIILVRYGVDQGLGISRLISERGLPAVEVASTDELSAALAQSLGPIVVDCSGLSKPFLFVAVRDALRNLGRVAVVHTMAEHHYPRNEDLVALGVDAQRPLPSEILEKLGEVLTGEAGPYRPVQVHRAEGSPERWRGLIASASPKNDRLLHLLDWRPYDATRILVPPPTTPRRRIAWASAELAASAADANVSLITVGTNDIDGALRASGEMYNDLYFGSGANVEVGLTGSKIHAVAFAALAAAARVSLGWYVVPASFDQQRFTVGTGETQCFDLNLEV